MRESLLDSLYNTNKRKKRVMTELHNKIKMSDVYNNNIFDTIKEGIALTMYEDERPAEDITPAYVQSFIDDLEPMFAEYKMTIDYNMIDILNLTENLQIYYVLYTYWFDRIPETNV